MLCFGWNYTAAQTRPYCAPSLGCFTQVETLLLLLLFLHLDSIPLLFSLAGGDGNVTGWEMSLGKSLSVQWCK